MEMYGAAMIVQQERARVNERINREGWMLETVDGSARGKFKDALIRRVRRSGEC